jgi:serine/threonine protein phosphatase PrpC
VSFTDGLLNLFDGTLESLDKVVDLVRASSCPQEIVDRAIALARRGRARDDLTIIAVTRA